MLFDLECDEASRKVEGGVRVGFAVDSVCVYSWYVLLIRARGILANGDRLVYPVHAYDGPAEEGDERKAGAESGIGYPSFV